MEDEWDDRNPESIDPDKSPAPGIGSSTRRGLLAFAIWMGGAELSIMGCAALFFSSSSEASSREYAGPLWQASVIGAVLGFLPAILAAVIVARGDKQPQYWALAVLSMLMTPLSGFTLMVLL